jgi:hypothetical protein
MKGHDMLYELREYSTPPGIMPALIKRNNEVSLPLFAKHGIEYLFMGVTEIGDNSDNELVYVVKWESYDDMLKHWRAFATDPEWIEAKAATEADGPYLQRVRRRFINPRSLPQPG